MKMRLELLGPEGAQRRMQELQARVQQLRGPDVRNRGGLGAPSAEFESLLAEWKPSEITGTIGGTAPFNPFGGGASVQATNLKPLIEQAAANHGLDPKLLEALVSAESGFDPRARSRAGAMGLTQLMPGTAEELGVTDPFDPVQSLNGGAKYLAQMLERFGSTELALAAYNAGPGRVERAGNQIPNLSETKNYVRKVMAHYEGGQ